MDFADSFDFIGVAQQFFVRFQQIIHHLEVFF